MNLIQRLRTCSAEERKTSAMELAKNGTDEAVRELVRMVGGKRRRWLSFYNFNEQKIGIEALGETRSKKALDYLKNLVSYEIKSLGKYYTPQSFDEEVEQECEINFPNARGKLSRNLRSVYCSRYYVDKTGEEIKEYTKSPKDVMNQKEEYLKIMSAIARLESFIEE